MRPALIFVIVIVVAAVVFMLARPGPTSKPDSNEAIELAWTEDFAEAKAHAAELNRPMLLNFSGSDWCRYCQKLDEEIFSTPQFEAFADENLVLVLVDFPRDKDQSAELKYQNQQLKVRYGFVDGRDGYPTLFITNPDGSALGRMGYMRGGPEPFLKELRAVLAR